jgi:hypothetical protein
MANGCVSLSDIVTNLSAGVATDALPNGTSGIVVSACDEITFVVTNTGGVNNITAMSVLFSNDGTRWSADSSVTLSSPVAPNGNVNVRLTDQCWTYMRLQLTSTSGTQATVDLFAKGYGRLL